MVTANYRGKSIIINPLFIIGMFIQVPEKGGFHTKRHHGIKDGNIAEHGGENPISARRICFCAGVQRRKEKT